MDFTEPKNFDVVRKVRRHEVSTFLITVAALERGLDVTFYRTQAEAGTRIALMAPQEDSAIFYSVSDGRKTHYFNATQNDRVSRSTAEITRNKVATKQLLHRKNIDTAIGGLVSAKKPQLLFDLARAGVRRFVLKPVTGSLGKGTFLNQTPEQAAEVLRLNPKVDYVIEQHIHGREHRVYVADGRIVAAYWYAPPSVTGDGARTIRQLYEEHQAIRAGNPFVVDRTPTAASLDLALLTQKCGWDTVPEAGRRVWLSMDPFPDAQGDFHVVTDSLPDNIRKTALATAQAVAAKHCAIDMIVDARGNAFVLEVNVRAMIGVHCFPFPTGVWNLDVPVAILRSFFAIKDEPVRTLSFLDQPALAAEVMREGRTGRGVRAADFATFA